MEEGLDRREALAVAFAGVERVELGVASRLDRLHAMDECFQRFRLRGDHGHFGLEAFDAIHGLDVREGFLGGLGVEICGFGRLFCCGVHITLPSPLGLASPSGAQEVAMRKGSVRIRPVYGRKIF
ncbi:MAG: hypothetical protein ACFHWZ_15140 [Phycisphaerales bacterium]